MSRDIRDEFRQRLIENAAWGRLGVQLNEDVEETGELLEEDSEYEDEFEDEVHVCPLCISQLDEEIDEERLLEHLDVVLSLADNLSQLNEGDEDIDSVIDDTIAEILFEDEDEDE